MGQLSEDPKSSSCWGTIFCCSERKKSKDSRKEQSTDLSVGSYTPPPKTYSASGQRTATPAGQSALRQRSATPGSATPGSQV